MPLFDRRQFLMTTLMTGFTAAVARAQDAPIHTDSTGLDAGEAKILVADGHLPAYYARPVGKGKFPIILVIEEIFGVHEYIKDICRRFAKLGYFAVAPELYARLADLSSMSDPHEIVSKVISKAPDATMLSDLDSTAAWAAANHGDANRLGVTGFCRGGRDTWLYAAHNPHLKAAVAWYGPVKGPVSQIQPHTAMDEASALHCPLLGLYGGRDESIRPADVQAAAQVARDAGHTAEIKIFPDAGHGFHADYRATYNKAAAEHGWSDAIAWFKAHGVA
jgi:carboxymethylenebutenolidase